jgi:CubicO group peptidase (beta-lactamase class C family)
MRAWLLALGLVASALVVPARAAQAMPAPPPPANAAAAATIDPAEVDAIARAAVARFQLPGLALGVIEDGEVVFARGYGETVAGSGEAVDTATVFKIASNSKAMTASVLARLVQAGKLRWDDPVVKHLPGFAMHDPWVTQHMTVADLLVHNSGLPEGGGDLMLWPEPNGFTRDDIVHGLRYIVPAYGFRAGYAYDNLLYVVAGEVAAAVGGAPYETLVRREIFGPLGLERCVVGEFDRDALGNVAQPHWLSDAGNQPMREDPGTVPAIASAPAGGIRCSLDDMLAWARNWLAPTSAQLQWLGPEQRAAMWKARTPMPISGLKRRWDDTHFYAYAFGFRLADMDGEYTVSHTGTLGGMYSMMMLLPDRKSGFVFMTNGNGGTARTVLGEILVKLFTRPGDTRTVDDFADDLARPSPAAPAAAASAAPVVPDVATRIPVAASELAPWLGTWRDPWFGEVRICAAGDGVEWRSAKSPKMHGTVARIGGRYMVHWDDPGVDLDAWLDFAGEGDARSLRMAKLDPEGDFSSDYEDLAFERTGDCGETMADAGLVDIRALVPDLPQDIRYAGSDNFVGAPVDGYAAPRCLLKVDAAAALARVDATLREQGYRLQPFDCYRPARAVAHFVRWAGDLSDQRTKAAHYPALDKSALLGEYIAPVSGHSRGRTVDLTLLHCPPAGACAALDMGTPFDFFDPRANTDSPAVTPAQRANRQRLLAAMQAEGFRNYPMEWWHFTLQQPSPDVIENEVVHDVPIVAGDDNRPGVVAALMQRYDGNVPGASLLVLRDGEPVVRRGYGLSDLAQATEAGPATNYRLASVSKQFTAAAILLLAQDGRLSLDDPARRWLPTLPAAAGAITLRHLLTHTSGLVDYEDLMGDAWQGQIRDAGVLALLEKEDRLYFPPGSAYRYSNGAYALLALVVEKASGLAYPEFLERRIFAPLGMHDTLAYVAGGPEVPHRAWGYSATGGGWERTDQSTTSAVLGDGGIYSSIDDLARWDAALYDDRLLSDASRALAFSPHVQVTGEPYEASYGFGWRITGDTLWHSGETIGFRNVIVRWPERHLTVILLSNRNGPEPYRTALRIGALYR